MANCYTERLQDGFFTVLEDQLRSLNPTATFALGAMSYDTEFCSVYFPPEKEKGFGRTQFYLRNNDGAKGDELGLVFFGEMCSSVYGTQISAKGNHTLGRVPKPITDESTVKDVLILRPLTGIFTPDSTFLEDAFLNQISTLQEIITESTKTANLHPKSALTTSWLVASDPRSSFNDHSLIKIMMPQKYKVPGGKDSNGKVRKKKNLVATSTSSQDVSDTDTLSDSGADGTDGPLIKLGALYDPSLLPDHRGRYFQQQNAKLVQLDIVDMNDNLIPPWEMSNKLREGTVVLVEATLICWHIAGNGNGDKDKKVYQIQGHRLRVLSESDEVVEIFDIPTLPQATLANDQIPPSSPRKKASSAFSSFASPSKRARLDSDI